MTQAKRKIPDLNLRLPKDKEHLKEEIRFKAIRANVPMTTVLIDAIEFYLGKRDRRKY